MDAVVFFGNFLQMIIQKEKLADFEDKLLLNNSRMKNLRGYIKWCVIEGIFLMFGAMILAAQIIPSKPEIYALISAGGFFAPFFVNYLFTDVIFEKRKRGKEEILPDLLLEASVFCDECSLTNTLKRITEQDFGLLSEDFKRIKNEIANGAGIEEALLHAKQLNKSRAFSRVIELLIQGYKSGAGMSQTFKETAEDLLETQAIIKERQAVMLVTKYTLLLAAGIIVPIVLGLIIGLVSGLNFNAMSGLELGLSAEARKDIFDFGVLGTNIYIAEYALLSSFFLALQEGNKKQFWVYALLLLPVALGAFFIAKRIW